MFPTHCVLGPVNYTKPVTPPKYRCTGCTATGVRLWRRYEFIYCAKCAESMERVKPTKSSTPGRSLQIGRMFAALPTEDGEAYWGYLPYIEEAPPPVLRWWRSLPTCKSEVAQ
jgi:hypothetical protein